MTHPCRGCCAQKGYGGIVVDPRGRGDQLVQPQQGIRQLIWSAAPHRDTPILHYRNTISERWYSLERRQAQSDRALRLKARHQWKKAP